MSGSLHGSFGEAGPTPPNALALFEHRAWVRSLARRLLADENAVDDVEQETWTAALRSGPNEPRALRSWLGSVASRFALQRLRGERRRARREEALAAAPPVTRPTADVVAEADAHGHVVQAVLALREPYRTTVILRYFEGLAVADVAARMTVPVETVRTRLRRAHEILRSALEREHGRPLAALLVPVCGAGAFDAASGASGGTAGWLAWGGVVMATSVKTVAAAALAGALLGALLTIAVTQALEDPGREDELAVVPPAAPDAGPRPSARGSGAGMTRPAADSARSVTPSPTPQVAGSASPAAPAPVGADLPAPAAGTITGHVRTKDGEPVEGAVVRASVTRQGTQSYRRGRVPTRPSEPDLAKAQLEWVRWHVATMREAVTDGSGSFTLRELWDADHSLSAYAEGYEVRAAGKSSNLRAGDVADFVATRICDVPVAVVDEEGRTPSKVLVRWSLPKGGGGSSAWCAAEDPVVQIEPGTWSVHAEIDRESRSAPVTVAVSETMPVEPVALTLRRRVHLEGRVRLDPADEGWRTIGLSLHPIGDDDPARQRRSTAASPEWIYRFDDLPPGEYELRAWLPGTSGSFGEVDPVLVERVAVAAATVRRELRIPRLSASASLVAHIFGPDGEPPREDELDVCFRVERVGAQTAYGLRATRRSDGTFLVPLLAADADLRIQRAHRRQAARQGGAGPDAAAEPPPPDGPATWKLEFRWKGRGEKLLEFVPGETRRVEVRFD